ncbi:MAG: hypothetical protein ACK5PD_06335, partial [Pirellulaceae bacterium]
MGRIDILDRFEDEYEYRPPRRTEYEYDEIRCDARTGAKRPLQQPAKIESLSGIQLRKNTFLDPQ